MTGELRDWETVSQYVISCLGNLFPSHDTPPDSIVKKVSYRDNPFFPRVLRKEMQTLKDKDPDAYSHIWEGELDIRKSGAVYARLIDKARSDGRITSVPYDPAYEVFTAWDLGWGIAQQYGFYSLLAVNCDG